MNQQQPDHLAELEQLDAEGEDAAFVSASIEVREYTAEDFEHVTL